MFRPFTPVGIVRERVNVHLTSRSIARVDWSEVWCADMWKQRSRDEARFSASCEFAISPMLPLSANAEPLMRTNRTFQLYGRDSEGLNVTSR